MAERSGIKFTDSGKAIGLDENTKIRLRMSADSLRIGDTKYGTLELHSAKVIRKEGDMFISALLITEERNSKFFWGKGFVSGR